MTPEAFLAQLQALRGDLAKTAREVSAQRRSGQPPTRLRVYPNYEVGPDGVYPRYFPGRNAVRVCNAAYVQEYRPSGTVIVPRMSCTWRGS